MILRFLVVIFFLIGVKLLFKKGLRVEVIAVISFV